jgi:hypothetical protein
MTTPGEPGVDFLSGIVGTAWGRLFPQFTQGQLTCVNLSQSRPKEIMNVVNRRFGKIVLAPSIDQSKVRNECEAFAFAATCDCLLKFLVTHLTGICP